MSDLRVGRNINTLRIPVFLEQFIYALHLFIYPSIRFKDGEVIKIICVSYVCCGYRDNRYRNSRNDIVFFRLIDIILLYYSCLAPKDTSRRGELEQRIKRTIPDTDLTLKKKKKKKKNKNVRFNLNNRACK